MDFIRRVNAMSVLFPSVYTQNTLYIADTLDDRCFDVAASVAFFVFVAAALIALSIYSHTQSHLCSFVRSFNRLFIFIFHWASQTKCMTCIYEVLRLLLLLHVFFSLIPLLIAGLFQFLRCILMLASLSFKFRGSHERNS